MIKENQLLFARSKEGAKIPTKRVEDAGYDIYACFEENTLVIPPHTTKMIPTGIHSACSEEYYIQLVERGSTGTKGIAQRCGVIDSGYRNEWFVPITNTTNKHMIISKLDNEFETYKESFGDIMPESFIYPYSKAICQAVVLPVPKMEVVEVPLEELQSIKSERGMGALGSSGK